MRHILLLGLACLSLALAGCGDKPKLTCTATGEACTANADCCTDLCDTMTGLCARGACLMADAECSSGPDCCSFSCVDFRCNGNACTNDNEACDSDGQCCSGICTDNLCAPLNPTCKTSGNACGANTECCSGLCKDSKCDVAPSFCTQVGDACTSNAECCGGTCTIASGQTLGTCALVPAPGGSQCSSAGEICGAGADYMTGDPLPTCGGECCSRACFPYGPSGVLICQPPSGCRPTGELCVTDNDCCGGGTQPNADKSNVHCSKAPGFSVGRCDQGQVCAPAGDICKLATTSCNDTDRCCAGTVQVNPTVCQQDSLGIPRCVITACDPNDPNCTMCDPATKVGMQCASSADCCGAPCTGNPETGFVCQGSCQPVGASCTTTADCCAGEPCVIPGGQTSGTCGQQGTCSAYGQTCDATHPCCEGLLCGMDGTCGGDIIL
jgi:hypothetical protein